MSIPHKKLGKNGPEVPVLGFGLMGLSAFYGSISSDEERFEVLDRAIELGETFWDSADIYGDSEDLLGKYFKHSGKRDRVFLATKFAVRTREKGERYLDSSPEYALQAMETSLKRLGLDSVDLFYCHRMDGKTPIEKTVEAMAQLVKQGKCKYIGLSECSAATLRRAYAVHPITAVQLEYSPFVLDIESDQINLLKTCRELGVAVVAYSPLGRGLLTGQIKSRADFEKGDRRLHFPYFSEENFPKNLELANNIGNLAKTKSCTAGQLALAWLMAQGDDIFPIPGTKRIKYLEENIGSVNVKLSSEEIAIVRQFVEKNGRVKERYPSGRVSAVFADTPEL